MPTYTHNDYYGYINKIQEQAIKDPQWFWSNDPKASEARQWLYNNDAEEIVDNIYNNTPEDIQKTIDSSKLSANSQFNKFHNDWKEKQNNAAKTVGSVLAASAIAPHIVTLGAKAVLNPYVRTAFDLIESADGIKNTFTKDGIQKTFQLTKEGDIKGAIKSGIGDILNLTGVGDTISSLSPLYKIAKYNPRLFKDSEIVKQLMVAAKNNTSNIIHSNWVDYDFEVPEVFAWATKTPRFKQAYSNGFEIFAKGFSKESLERARTAFDGRLGSRYVNQRSGVTAIFGGDLPMAGSYTGRTMYGDPNNMREYKKFHRNQKEGSIGLFVVPNTKTVGVNGNGKVFGEITYPNIGGPNLHNTGTDSIANHLAKYNGENFVYHNTFDGYQRTNGQWPNGIIYMSTKGKYPKSVFDSDMKFDLEDGSPFKKQGGTLKAQIGTKLLTPHKDYLGTPYKQDGNYNYFEAHPTHVPTKPDEHWDSRNPVTGQLLKSENHPTFNLLLNGEQEAGMQIYRGLNGELYSYPKEQYVPLYLKKYNYVAK